MWKRKVLVVPIVFILTSIVVFGLQDKFITKGKWDIEHIEKCPDHDSYPFMIDLRKKKLNRTHDGFDGVIDLSEDFTEDLTISSVICKKLDGGCKTIIVKKDESFCGLFFRYAENSIKAMLRNMGAEDHCPIPKGHYELNDFMFDYTELPEDGMVGSFKTIVYAMKDTEEMACFIVHSTFLEDDEE